MIVKVGYKQVWKKNRKFLTKTEKLRKGQGRIKDGNKVWSGYRKMLVEERLKFLMRVFFFFFEWGGE